MFGLPSLKYHNVHRYDVPLGVRRNINLIIRQFIYRSSAVSPKMLDRLRKTLFDHYNFRLEESGLAWSHMRLGTVGSDIKGSKYLHVYCYYRGPKKVLKRWAHFGKSTKTHLIVCEAYRVKPGGGTSGTVYGYGQLDGNGRWKDMR